MIEINLQLINFSDKYVVWLTTPELLRDFSDLIYEFVKNLFD